MFLYLSKSDEPAEVERPRIEREPIIVNEENRESVLQELEDRKKDSHYTTQMTVDWVFEGSSSNAYVANHESNTRTVYFDVLLKGTDEVVYTSPYLDVGAEIRGFSLDTDLPVGKHDAIVRYALVDDDNNVVATMSVAVTLDVKK